MFSLCFPYPLFLRFSYDCHIWPASTKLLALNINNIIVFFTFALPSVQLPQRAAKFENRLRETTAAAIYIDTVEIIVDAIWITGLYYLVKFCIIFCNHLWWIKIFEFASSYSRLWTRSKKRLRLFNTPFAKPPITAGTGTGSLGSLQGYRSPAFPVPKPTYYYFYINYLLTYDWNSTAVSIHGESTERRILDM